MTELKLQIADSFSMSAVDYANQGNSILGIRGSGKTYGATKIAEQLLNSNIPIVAFDPTGVWQHLRDGIDGHAGYPVVVVGGKRPDIELHESTAVSVLDAALKAGISIVFDFKGLSTSHKTMWVNIVGDCVEHLLAVNDQYGLRHVFIEEAAEFVPQKLDPTPRAKITYSRVESLARMGRNFGLGYTLINQRAEEVAKAILEICEQVFLFRQVGKNSIKSIKDWLEYRGIESGRDITSQLPFMKAGECYVINELGNALIHILPKVTFHPDPKTNKVLLPANAKTADVSSFVETMRDLLALKPDEKELVDNKKISKSDKKHIAELEKKIHSLEQQIKNNEVLIKNKQNEHAIMIYDNIMGLIEADKIAFLGDDKKEPVLHKLEAKATPTSNTETSIKNSEGSVTKGNAPMRMLQAAAMFPKGITKSRMCIIAGIKTGGSTYRNGMSVLRTQGYINGSADHCTITSDGIKAAGKVEKPKDLVQFWLNIIGKHSAPGRMLSSLNKVYPNSLSRTQLCGMVNIENGGSTYRNGISVLRKNKLVVSTGKDQFKMNEELK